VAQAGVRVENWTWGNSTVYNFGLRW